MFCVVERFLGSRWISSVTLGQYLSAGFPLPAPSATPTSFAGGTKRGRTRVVGGSGNL